MSESTTAKRRYSTEQQYATNTCTARYRIADRVRRRHKFHSTLQLPRQLLEFRGEV